MTERGVHVPLFVVALVVEALDGMRLIAAHDARRGGAGPPRECGRSAP